MNNKQIPAILNNNREPDRANRTPTRYRLWKGSNDLYWNNPNNWSGTGVPSGTSHVLFAGNSKLFTQCLVNTDIDIQTMFCRRDSTSPIIFSTSKNLTFNREFRNDALNVGLSFNFNNIVLKTGHFIVDSPAYLALGQSNLQLSGNLLITQADPIENLTTITYRSSGNYIYSVIPLNKINIFNHTDLSGSVAVEGRLNLSGTAHMAAGNLILTGPNSRLNVATGGWTYGNGAIIIENEGYIENQSGYLDNDALMVKNHNIGNALVPATYSCRNIQFYNDDISTTTITLQNGTYHFDSNVEFISSGGGTLRINNVQNNPNIHFHKNIDVIRDQTTNSRIDWVVGTGISMLHPPESFAKAFGRFRDGRGATNIVDLPKGLVTSHKNSLNEDSLIWMLNETGTTPVQVNVITRAADTVGGLYLNVTGIEYGDLDCGRTPATATEQLYIGDIGDNLLTRTGIKIYQVAEPTITGYEFSTIATFRTYEGSYETGANIPWGEGGGIARDCRAMFVTYPSTDIYFITHKTTPAQLFQMTGHSLHLDYETLFYRGNLRLGSGIVGANLTRDGSRLLVKTWNEVYYYDIAGTGSTDIWYALTGTDPIRILDYSPDYLEQGITWGSGNRSFHTLATFNSGLHDPLYKSPFYTYDQRATINLSGMTLDNLVIDSSGHQKVFTSSGSCESFALDVGLVDIHNQTIDCRGDFYVGPDANFKRRGFNNAIINVSGDLLMVGPAESLYMHPDSGDGAWQLNVVGTANVYRASVRASNANGGSIIRAYNSYDYGNNYNWTFGSGGVPSSGDLYLITAGSDGSISNSGSMNFSIYGKSGDSTGSLYLYLGGASSATISGGLYLITSGSPNIASSGISLFINSTNPGGNFPLFVQGNDFFTGVLYLVLYNGGLGSGVDLYIQGSIPTGGNLDMSIVGSSPYSSGIDLILSSNATYETPNNRGRLYINGRHIN